ncbi:MAG: hypothetical protein ABI389_05020 [Rhodanobacter sp.]
MVDGRTLYVNTNDAPVTVSFAGTKRGVLRGSSRDGALDLPGHGVALMK